GIVQGKDPDGITVASLVHGARQLAASDFDRAGPLGPAAAFDPEAFLNHLAHRGITWAIDPPR
ncbi:MAG: saccharopine dehydrogenase, partial [Acidiferrobacterales bacterium]